MTDKELAQHLTIALEIARAKFHGLAAAVKCGEPLDMDAVYHLLQAGNVQAGDALKQSPYWTLSCTNESGGANMDEYHAVVHITRYLSEDEEVVREKYPNLSLEEALRRQLKDELQEACDNGMAGDFQIDPITLTQP